MILLQLHWECKRALFKEVSDQDHGNGLGKVVDDVRRACYGANVLDDAIAVLGHEVYNAKGQICKWLGK